VRLTELRADFIKALGAGRWKTVRDMKRADGVQFLCPTCFQKNGGPRGTHLVICWRPHISQSMTPRPGRWQLQGTSLEDLTLVAGSSSVQIKGGCNAHFFVRNGEIVFT
jgi:hypothetical protein